VAVLCSELHIAISFFAALAVTIICQAAGGPLQQKKLLLYDPDSRLSPWLLQIRRALSQVLTGMQRWAA